MTSWAELSGEVVIVGVRDHIEVWAVEKWEQYMSQCDGQYEQLAEVALVGRGPDSVSEKDRVIANADEVGGKVLPR